jgi:cytochrome c biogenesis factor
MSSPRTKVLIWCAGLIGLILVTPLLLPTVMAYLFSKFPTNSTIFVSVHIYPAPFITCVVIWVAVVVCTRVSFLYDKRRGPDNRN